MSDAEHPQQTLEQELEELARRLEQAGGEGTAQAALLQRARAELIAHQRTVADLRLLTTQMPSVLWTVDARLRVEHLAGADPSLLQQATGLRPGCDLEDVFGADDTALSVHRQALAGRAGGYRLRLSQSVFGIRVEPRRDTEGHIDGCIGLAMDITERTHMEQELQTLQREIHHADRMGLLNKVVADLAHELNQPLAANVSYAQTGLQLIRQQRADQAVLTEVLEQVVSQSKRASQLIQQLRTTIRIRHPHRRRMDLNALVREVVDLVRWREGGRGPAIELILPASLPPVKVDALQFKQALLSLLDFSLSHLTRQPDGHRLSLELTCRDDTMALTLSDDGPGLDNQAMSHLFEPSLTHLTSNQSQSLAISRATVEAHGGRLWAEARTGNGTIFHLTLPVED